MTGIQKAVRLAGSQARLADQLGVTQQAISEWVQRGFVPVARLVEIEAQYGVSRLDLVDPQIRDVLEGAQWQ